MTEPGRLLHPPKGDTFPAGGNTPSSPGRSFPVTHPLAVQAHLTDRDLTIADWLDRHGVLTTAQLTAAFFTSPITAAHRLAKLHALSIVDRFHRPLPGGGFGPWHWVIGPLGAELTAVTRNTRPPTPRALRQRHASLANPRQLPHRLGTNQFFVDLHTHARHHDTTRLLRWWSEHDTAQRYQDRIHPDGHALWSDDGVTIGLFLEYDTAGRQDLGRLVDKLDAYHTLARDGGPAYPILFSLHAANRERNLHELLAHQRPGPVAVATTVRNTSLGCDPAGAVWALAGNPRPRRRLIELPSRHARPGSLYNPRSGVAWDLDQ